MHSDRFLFYSKKEKLVKMTTRCHSLVFVVTCCHSLSFVVTRSHLLSLAVIRCHVLSFVVPFDVTTCCTKCFYSLHLLSLVITLCITRLFFYKRSVFRMHFIYVLSLVCKNEHVIWFFDLQCIWSQLLELSITLLNVIDLTIKHILNSFNSRRRGGWWRDLKLKENCIYLKII